MKEETQLELAAKQEVAPSADMGIMAVIARAAADPTVDVAKMQALLAMHERLAALRAETEFKAALARIQPRMPRVSKLGKIEVSGVVRSRFARYEDVDEMIRPLLGEEGFAVDFDTEMSGAAIKVILRVSHREGHSELRSITLPVDGSGSKNSVQGVGSTVSYGKRYLIVGFFNIITVDEDNDGAGDVITEDQANKINDMLIYTSANRAKFLEWVGVPEVADIPAARYDAIMVQLKRKEPKR